MNIAWTTLASVEEAEDFARELVKQRLAFCCQVEGPIRSFYTWEDKLENAEEYRLTLKFLRENTEKVEEWVKKHHPYDVPQWIVVAVDRVLPSYREWAEEFSVRTEIKKPKKDILRLSKQGRSLLRKRRFPEAEKVFMEALALDDHNPYILVGLADTLREMHRFQDSIPYYDRVLEFDPVNVFALRGVGDSYRGVLQHKRAIPYWLRYLEQNKKDIYVMVRLAESFNKIGEFAKAEEFYLRALKVNPKDKYALLGIGSLYYKIDEDEKALEYFEKLLAIDGEYVAVLTMAGNIYRRQKNYQQAIPYYERAIALEADNTFALYGMGDCSRGLERLEDAVDWWSKILVKETANQELLTRVGDAYLNMGRVEEAKEQYNKSLDVGFDLYALLGLSRAYRREGNGTEARHCCEKILAKVDNHPRALEELMAIHVEFGDEASAAAVKELLASAVA